MAVSERENPYRIMILFFAFGKPRKSSKKHQKITDRTKIAFKDAAEVVTEALASAKMAAPRFDPVVRGVCRSWWPPATHVSI